MCFADEVKQLRQKSMLSQESFAKELGVSFATVNRWEKSRVFPSYKARRNIRDYCESHHMYFDIEKYIKQREELVCESRKK